MEKSAKIYIAGHRGLVGSAILQELKDQGYENLILRTHKQLDLTDQQQTAQFFKDHRPDYVFLAAATVGGIVANNIYRADFIYKNLMIQNNVIHHSYLNGVKKLLFLGSTCIYPKMAPQPMPEDSLLTGPLEYTNEPYAIAKIAGIKMCESYNLQYGTNFISVMPTNLYGPNDNFDLEKSHVLPALIRKMHLGKLLMDGNEQALVKEMDVENFAFAKAELSKHGITKESIELWGTGSPRREFLWSHDMAKACVYLMHNIDFKDVAGEQKEVRNTHLNIGTGEDIEIKELAALIKKTVGYTGKLNWDSSKPDGTPRKLTDVSKLHALGWKHEVSLEKGVDMMYEAYLDKA
ncbi:GDP-L-fucose synthase family protein [Nonlabens ponticola]|uniref:GDP-L-fucose synthase n=1 Tax=Nonlabens ponticola TaxID=2496866 RepID=A0A3S9MVB6_9FLAO|nr:GDP-L-fucose synthase [Nonlabens ponticola]AZQ43125.1 GDP-L-fucose synthase [Nonlabens ponticola]